MQTWCAWHGVAPKRLTSRVSSEPQRGQIAAADSSGQVALRSGGAIPYARSFARPSSVIQSVVQAGARTNRTSASS